MTKPKRGTEAWLRLELRHAERMADRWSHRVTVAVGALNRWNRRERVLAARLAAGPQPPRPRRERPPRRAIKLEGQP